MPELILRLTGVDIGFAGEEALVHDINLEAYAGEVIGLNGVSGIGKTTLLRTLAGLVPPLIGELEVLGQSDLSQLPRGSIGYIPQRLGLVHHQTVGYNALMGALPGASWWQTLLSLPSGEMRQAARDAIEAVGLSEKMLDPVSLLSGGEQRRVAVARSLVQRPRLLLADECLGELDETTSETVAVQLLSLAREHDTCIVLIDHSPARTAALCDRVLNFRRGRLVEDEPGLIRLPMLGGDN